MPDAALIDLSRFRLEKAAEMLDAAKRDFREADYASANNRAYYCIFHAMRALLALDGEDYRKHSAVIARFTMNYLKTVHAQGKCEERACQCAGKRAAHRAQTYYQG